MSRLTWNEIMEAYDGNQVGLINIKKDKDKQIASAEVSCSTKMMPYSDMLEMALSGKICMVYMLQRKMGYSTV